MQKMLWQSVGTLCLLMGCASLGFGQDVKALMIANGLTEGSNSAPAEFVIEKAFAG